MLSTHTTTHVCSSHQDWTVTTTILAPDGVTVRTDSAIKNIFGYTGREYDTRTTLYHFRARYYSPQLGRFTTRDPLGYVDGGNLYANYFGLEGMDPGGMAKKCAITMLDHGGVQRNDWHSNGEEFTGDPTTVLDGAKSQADILNFVRKNGCCEIKIIGHQGGPDGNFGGTVTYTGKIDAQGNEVVERLFPNFTFENRLKRAIKDNNCWDPAITIGSCGASDTITRTVGQSVANNTNCKVIRCMEPHLASVSPDDLNWEAFYPQEYGCRFVDNCGRPQPLVE